MTFLKMLIRRRQDKRPAKARRSLWADREGAAFVYVTITAVALFAMVALVIDLSRMEITHTAARSAAESAALAGASQLDGRIDAITRAERAAGTIDLVENDQKLAAGGGSNVQIVNMRFLDGLPAGDPTLPEDPSALDAFVLDKTDPDSALEARFIEVTTEQLTVNNSFIQAVGGNATGTSTIRATAVAGLTQTICRRAPLAICNPMENPLATPGTPGPPLDAEAWRGRQILVKGAPKSGSAAWTPGDFSLVDIDGEQNTAALWAALAESEPDICVSAIINPKPGNVAAVNEAVNVRFDMYPNNNAPPRSKTNPKMYPAQNVTKGKVRRTADNCDYTDPDPGMNSMALPRDQNSQAHGNATMQTGAPSNTSRFGDGTWNCALYWSTMHPLVPAPSGCTSNSTPADMTRQQLYRHELESVPDLIPDTTTVDANGNPVAPFGENGDPTEGMCYQGPTPPSDVVDRRELFFAVINCREYDVKGNSTGDVPVEAFVRAFLTEPVANPPDGPEIYLEIVDIARPGALNGVLHDIVQLYR